MHCWKLILSLRTRNCRSPFQYRKVIFLLRFSDLVIVIRWYNWSRTQGIINNKNISSGTVQERRKVAETHSRLNTLFFRRCRRDQFHSATGRMRRPCLDSALANFSQQHLSQHPSEGITSHVCLITVRILAVLLLV